MLDGFIESAGAWIDIAGVVVIVTGTAIATIAFVRRWLAGGLADAYVGYRHNLGRAILLGLELLVAADIIRTVAVAPTLQNVLLLGLIVLIRTFLSVALEVELEGRWPWRRAAESPRTPAA